ncbi:hypothetical protein [Rufibacter ruber]|uniref:hypothetical protein n=1 Tax=Rufibacter ruber TaxID=1783499 RepID=UPI000833FF3D|nr:hypothetical protein [Rufibacter ruber]
MTLNNIVEICVAIDVAILGIAYPIIVDKISNIGDKYSSNYLVELFRDEFPHRVKSFRIFGYDFEISVFKIMLIATMLSFASLIFEQKPILWEDNWFVSNSADLLVFIFSFLLISFFFIWLDKVALYNGKSTVLFNHIIKKYKILNKKADSSKYYLKTLNEISVYALNKPDVHIQESVLQFYHEEFARCRRQHDKSMPIVYPYDLYEFIYMLNVESIKKENAMLVALEHIAVSGSLLLGEDFEEISISKETYDWLWRILNLNYNKPVNIKAYWAKAFQYFEFNLKRIDPVYEEYTIKILNQKRIDERDTERKNFLEFHYVLGGMLLYGKQYDALNYIFKYSQSQPPKYVLLPNSMTDIFQLFDEFNNDINYRRVPLDIQYYFPGLDNLGNRNEVNYWACSYISLLFVRQFSLNKYYTYQDFTAFPQLPSTVNELENWKSGLSYFRLCFDKVINNEELMRVVGFEIIMKKKEDEIFKFLSTLETEISEKIHLLKRNVKLSAEKRQLFIDKSRQIIKKAFSDYSEVFRISNYEDVNDLQKIDITGGRVMLSRSTFTDGDIPVFGFESYFANEIVRSNIKYLIPLSFQWSSVRRYLLSRQNLLKGIDRLKVDDEYAIVAVNVFQEVCDELRKTKLMVIRIPSSYNDLSNVVFILKKDELPFLEHKELTEENIVEDKLILIDKDIKLYYAINEISSVNGYQEEHDDEQEDEEVQVEVSLAFLAVLSWKNKRNIIQIDIESSIYEQGIPSDINDIEPF